MIDTQNIYSWKKPFFIASVCSLALLFLSDLATRLYLYSMYPWFDIPMHFMGGFVVGVFCIGLQRFFGKSETFIYTMCGVLLIGVAWEVIELYFKVSVLFGGNLLFDTVKDLLVDSIGGILSYICFHQYKKNLLK